MSHSTESRRRIRLDGWCHAGLVSCVGFAWLMSPQLCQADEPHQQPASSDARQVAPNQSVVLDDRRDEVDETSEGRADGLRAPAEMADAGGAERQSERLSTQLRRRDPQRPKRTAADLSDGKSAPWFRTGLGALGIVLALIVLAVWLVRRWLPAARVVDSSVLNIVGRASLSPKHSLALVQVGRRFVLVGISSDRLSGLCEVADPDEVAELSVRTGAGMKPPQRAFGDLLLHETESYQEADHDEPESAESVRAEGPRISRPLTELLKKLRNVKVG